MTRCCKDGCRTKITLAMSVSTSLCSCGKVFCAMHKSFHVQSCESSILELKIATKVFNDRLLQNKTVVSPLARI